MSDHLPGQLADWIGRTSRSQDVVTERLDTSFRAVLAPHIVPTSDGEVPPGLHWCLCPAIADMADLGPDGHPAKNRDLPPVPLPRRMWAGGMVETFDALRVGDGITRISTISGITHKHGRSGELWFVTVTHQYETVRGIAIRDRQDIVYRAAAAESPAEASAPIAPPSPRPHSRHWSVQTSPVLLFRYSAIASTTTILMPRASRAMTAWSCMDKSNAGPIPTPTETDPNSPEPVLEQSYLAGPSADQATRTTNARLQVAGCRQSHAVRHRNGSHDAQKTGEICLQSQSLPRRAVRNPRRRMIHNHHRRSLRIPM